MSLFFFTNKFMFIPPDTQWCGKLESTELMLYYYNTVLLITMHTAWIDWMAVWISRSDIIRLFLVRGGTLNRLFVVTISAEVKCNI